PRMLVIQTPASASCTPIIIRLPTTAAPQPAATSRRVGGGGVGNTTTATKAAPSSTMSPMYSTQRPATPTGETGDDPVVSVSPPVLGGVEPTPKANEPRARWPSTE